MKLKDAKKLHRGDEVIVKQNGRIMQVVETETSDDMRNVDVMLEDGVWYGHKEIK